MKRIIILCICVCVGLTYANETIKVKAQCDKLAAALSEFTPSIENLSLEKVMKMFGDRQAPYTIIYEHTGLFEWQLFPQCYYESEVEEKDGFTYVDVDYKPTSDYFANVPAYFYIKTKRSYTDLADYKYYQISLYDAIVTGKTVLIDQESNKYGYPGYEYAMSFYYSGLKMVLHAYFLLVDDICCFAYYTTGDTFYGHIAYQMFFDLYMNVLEFTQPSNASQSTSKPISFSLDQNYPNPFNNSTTINYSVSMNSPVKLELFNIQGKHIETLISEYHQAGNYSFTLDASKLSTGLYIYQISNNQGMSIKRMLLLK